MTTTFSRFFAWNNGQGPWGGAPKPSSSRTEKPSSEGPRAPRGPAQPELEDVLNGMAEQLKGFWRSRNGGGNGGNENFWPLAGLGVAAVWLLSGFYIVAPDQQGVVQRFGAFVQVSQPGLNYHLPWPVETVTKIPVTRENVMEFGFRTLPGDRAVDVPEESMMLTGDENIVALDFTVRWKVADSAKFLFNVANTERTVFEVAESVMRETVGRHPIDDALTDNKAKIQAEARKHLQAVLDYYQAGVQITGVELQQVNPPAEVLDAFRDVQAARADAEKAINEAQGYANQVIPQARGQSAQILQQAEGYKTSTIAAAEGQASRFRAQVQAYQANPGVTRDRLYYEAMTDVLQNANKVVVSGKGGNLLPFLPLDRMAPKPAAGPAAQQGGTN